MLLKLNTLFFSLYWSSFYANTFSSNIVLRVDRKVNRSLHSQILSILGPVVFISEYSSVVERTIIPGDEKLPRQGGQRFFPTVMIFGPQALASAPPSPFHSFLSKHSVFKITPSISSLSIVSQITLKLLTIANSLPKFQTISSLSLSDPVNLHDKFTVIKKITFPVPDTIASHQCHHSAGPYPTPAWSPSWIFIPSKKILQSPESRGPLLRSRFQSTDQQVLFLRSHFLHFCTLGLIFREFLSTGVSILINIRWPEGCNSVSLFSRDTRRTNNNCARFLGWLQLFPSYGSSVYLVAPHRWLLVCKSHRGPAPEHEKYTAR